MPIIDATTIDDTDTTVADEPSPAGAKINPASTTSLIAALDIGECFSKAIPVMAWITVGDFADQGKTMRDMMRNALTSSMTQASKRTGNRYSMEITSVVTSGSKLYNVAIITRVE